MEARILAVLGCFVSAAAFAAQSPQVPIVGNAIPQFVQPLPLLSVHPQAAAPNVLDTRAVSGPLTLTMCEFRSHVLPPGTLAAGQQPETWTWGYVAGDTCPTGVQETYLGPVLVNTRGVPTEINFVNKLGSTATTQVLAYKYFTDQTLDWADPAAPQEDGIVNFCNSMGGIPLFGSVCAHNYTGAVAAVPHLHGGEVPPELDGGPDAWFTSDGLYKGQDYYTKSTFTPTGLPPASYAAVYRYPNGQQAAPMWFHDHVLGATRLNVYAGLAGAYYIVDPAQQLPAGFPAVAEVVPLVLQDRMFDTNGQLFFPGDTAGGLLSSPNPEHPYWVPEFVGDTIVVNGKAWPFLDVQPKRYRFLLLNGSNARTYELSLSGASNKAAPHMWGIGNDDGYIDPAGPGGPGRRGRAEARDHARRALRGRRRLRRRRSRIDAGVEEQRQDALPRRRESRRAPGGRRPVPGEMPPGRMPAPQGLGPGGKRGDPAEPADRAADGACHGHARRGRGGQQDTPADAQRGPASPEEGDRPRDRGREYQISGWTGGDPGQTPRRPATRRGSTTTSFR